MFPKRSRPAHCVVIMVLLAQLFLLSVPIGATKQNALDGCTAGDAGDSWKTANVLNHVAQDCRGALDADDVDWFTIPLPETSLSLLKEIIHAWACTNHGGLQMKVYFRNAIEASLGLDPGSPEGAAAGVEDACAFPGDGAISVTPQALAGGAWYIEIEPLRFAEEPFQYDLHLRFSS